MERNKTVWGMILLMAILFIPMISALEWDNVVSDKPVAVGDSYRIGYRTFNYNELWAEYKPLQIKNAFGLGSTLADVVLTRHDTTCGESCLSQFTICTGEESAPIDALYFYRLDEGKREERDIRSSNFQYIGDITDYTTECSPAKLTEEEIKNGTKQYDVCIQVPSGSHKGLVNYNIGERLPAGCYDYTLNGQKAPYMSIDWVIKTQGKLLESWATWGNISTGSQAEVRLNSPATGSTQYVTQVNTSAFANVTNGAYLVNTTLYDNSTGSWGARNTTNINVSNIAPFSLTVSAPSTESASPRAGLGFTVLSNGQIVNITKHNSCTADTAYLYLAINSTWENGTLLASASFVGNVATFNYAINTSSAYLVMAGLASAGAYTRTTGTASYPQTTSQISVNGFAILENGVLQTTNYRNIIGITTSNTTILQNITVNYTNTYTAGQTYNWNQRFCDSDGACGFATSNRTFFIGNITVNSISYNSTTYETANENYSIDISSNPVVSNVYFNYSSVIYPTTNSGDIWYSSKEINSSMFGNNSFNFIYTYKGNNISDSTYYQNVSPLVFALCNSTYSTRFLNLTFKDETTLGALNGTIPTATFVYYLDNSLLNKTLSYINTSENLNYSFCSNAVNRTLNIDSYVQYASTGYPQRIWNPAVTTYNNTTTLQTLYLLGTANGIYTTFQIVNGQDQLLSGVSVNAVRSISSTDVNVCSGTTGDDGTVTCWLNPDFTHNFTFAKTGFTTYSTSFPPTQSSYTITLGGGTGTVVSDYTRGMNTYLYPTQQELFNNTAYTFGINVTSSYWSLDSFGYNLRLANGTIITGATSTTSGTAATSSYNVNNQSIIYIDYYWVIEGNTTSGTKYWIVTNSANTGWSIKNFFTRLNTYMAIGFFGLDDFGRYLIVFLVLFVSIGIMSYKYSLTSPLAVTLMTFLIIFFFDVVVGLLPTIRGIDNLLTYIAGLILAVVVLKEVTQ